MAIYSGMFNSVNSDRKYNAWWFALFFSTFVGNGIFPNPSTNLQVMADDGLKTTVKEGKGWINGYFIFSDNDHVLQHDNADGVLKRIDRIVLRLDYLEREIDIVIKKGTYASAPVAPVLQRDADAYELALADVLIDRGATQITQANITDQRLNKDLCGLMHAPVHNVDTTTLFNQYQSWIQQQKEIYETDLENWTADQHAEFLSWRADEEILFNAWFESIKDILDENAAGNLLQMIEQHIEEKGQPGGYPELDDEGKVPIEQLPPMNYISTSEKGTPGGVPTLDNETQVPREQLLKAPKIEILFGNGMDGNVTISSNTTLTRDMYYNNLTINSGRTLKTNGYKIFVKETLTNNGMIDNNGENGTNGTGSTSGVGGAGGGGGGSGGNAGVGIGNGTSGGGAKGGGNGGRGGNITATPSPGADGGTTTYTVSDRAELELIQTLYETAIGGGGGGGGGSSHNNYKGGGGGGSGGRIHIYAKIINNNGTISSIGGNGGNGYILSPEFTAGGGGGGGGGFVLLTFETYTGANPIVSGGTGGTGGYPSGNGASGRTIKIKLI